jgi:hypothetical protein
MWRTGVKHTSSIYQVCVIISEATEEDGENNLVINLQNFSQGNSHKKEREKVYVSAEEWGMIKSAVNHGTTIPAESRREVLMGYQYALHQHKKQLLQEISELRRSHESASTANRTQWEERSNASHSSEERYREPKHNRGKAERPHKENRTQNFDSSCLLVEEVRN